MANNILIEFKATGNQAVVRAIKELHLEQVRLQKGQKKYEASLKKVNKGQKNASKGMLDLTNSGRLVQNSFATLRSKMLLVAFAASIVQQSVMKLVKLFGEQELAERRLSIALGRTSKALLDQATALQKVTTFGDEAIIGVQTSIAAFIKDEDQIKLATKATLDLAAAKGMDLKTAADLVAKSIGSSTNALKRYGIEGEGSAGSTERLESIVESIQDRFGGFAEGELETTIGKMKATANAVGDAGEAFGQVLAPVVIIVAKAMKLLAERLNPARIRAYTVAMIALSVATGHFARAMVWVNAQLALMRIRLIKSGIGIAILAVGELAYQMGVFGGSTEDATETIEDQVEALQKQDRAIDENIKTMKEQLSLLEVERDLIGEVEDEALLSLARKKKSIELGRLLVEEERELIRQMFYVEKEMNKEIKSLKEREKILKKNIKKEKAFALALEKTQEKIADYNISIVGLNTVLDNLLLQGDKARGFSVSDIILSPDELTKYQSRLVLLSKITDEGFDLDRMYEGHSELVALLEEDGVSLAHAFAMGWESVGEYTAGTFDDLMNVWGAGNQEVIAKMVLQQETMEKIIDAESYVANAKKVAIADEEKRKNTANLILEIAKLDIAEHNLMDVEELMMDLWFVKNKAEKESLLLTHQKTLLDNEEFFLEKALLDVKKKVTDEIISENEANEIKVEIYTRLLEIDLEQFELGELELEQLAEKKKRTEDLTKAKNDAYTNGIKNALNLAKALSKNEEDQKNIAFALAMVDAVKVGTGTWKELTANPLVPYPMPGILAGIEFAAAAAMANKIRTMEEGGLIGGQRHSQGGTLIEAERGEFIMNRRAVESIGADNLSRMNQGGGGININVTGNVLSSDFVEGELADKISEAVRKGVDFGVS